VIKPLFDIAITLCEVVFSLRSLKVFKIIIMNKCFGLNNRTGAGIKRRSEMQTAQYRHPFSFRSKANPKSVVAAMIFLCLILAFPSLVMAATTYYVSAGGNDATNNGTSSSKPFKTLTKISTLALGPGDQVLLKCGDTFTDGFYP